MKKTTILKAFCVIFSITMASCATNSFSNQGLLHGMVTDLNGEPVANYSIANSNKKIVTSTDDRGFFSLDLKNSRRKDFLGYKQNWQSMKFDFSQAPINRLYIIQIKSAKDLKNEFENFLEQGNYFLAEKALSDCEDGAIPQHELAMYKSLLAYKKNDFHEAKRLLSITKENPSETESSIEFCKYKNLLESKIQDTDTEKGE
ncbi:MAG: carboxypeptidase-like regulatory domain-containing protein [Treponema sp.]|nr:carboxypeptidase-like regulatory domain-containing protein [Treponema sp.]